MKIIVNIPTNDPDIYRKFVCNNLGGNNNKWWEIRYWINDDVIEVQFNRIGEPCYQPKVYKGGIDYPLGQGQKFMDSKIHAKTRTQKKESHYTEVKLADKEIITESTERIDPRVEQRVAMIFQAANENIAQTLVGKVDALSADQIDEATEVLKEITSLTDEHSETDVSIRDDYDFVGTWLVPKAERYYNLIPTDLGRKIFPVEVAIKLAETAAAEEDRLQQLKAALAGNKIKRQGGSILDQLGAQLRFVDPLESAFLEVQKLINQSEFKPKIKELYEVTIPNERSRFEKETRGSSKLQMLYHGTPLVNVRHILRTGLIVPQTEANGRAFGHGIYWADEFKKSYGYSGGYGWNEKMLFIGEIKVGKQYVTCNTNKWRLNDLPSGHDSLYAPGKKPIEGIHAGSLTWSEYVVYSPSQQTIRYVVVV